MPTIKKLYFSSGASATAPSDLSLTSSTTFIQPYVDDAAFVTANGTAAEGDIYLNTTSDVLRVYADGAWANVVMPTLTQTLTNKTINGSSNTITNVSLTSGVTGILPIANGGSGQATANAALNALLPSQTANSGKYLKTDGTNTSWDTAGGGGGSESVLVRTNADYTVLDGDGYTTILFSTGATDRTLTLPTLSANANRVIRVKKIDAGVGTVIIDGESTETIDGATTRVISQQYEEVEIQGYTSEWAVLNNGIVTGTTMGYMPSSNAHLDNIAATRMGLKVYSHGTSYNGGNAPTVTLTAGGGTLSSVDLTEFIPYQMQSGNWRLKFNVVVSLSVTARTSVELTVAGLTFKNVPTSGIGQSIAGDCGTTATLGRTSAKNNSGILEAQFSSVSNGAARFSGDVLLESKPTWAY